MNEIPYYSWKGKTLEQITSVIQKNKKTLNTNGNVHQLRKPMPLNIYRKEINVLASPATKCSRKSVSISAFEQPGGSIVNSNVHRNTGLVNTLDITPTTITSEYPDKCKYSSSCFLSPDLNAKRRVRSAGMIHKNYKINNNNDKAYFTSSNEYLVARNRTIQQNSYIYFRQSSSGVQPGTGNAKSNVYSSGNVYTPGGLNHCYQPMISEANENNYFTYTWVDGNEYPVIITDGQYTTDSLNDYFKRIMISNGHYFYDHTGMKYFLLTIDYDNFNNQVILEANPASKNLPFPPDAYTPACGFDVSGSWYNNLPDGNIHLISDGSYNFTSFGIPYTEAPNYRKFNLIVGFSAGSYYNGTYRSTFRPTIGPNYVPLYYKPSNITFGIQGPVDSSTYVDRVKYNTVTRNGYLTKSAYGTAAANALAYGVSEQPYTIKNIVGFQNIATPIIKSDGSVCRNDKFIYRR